MWEFHGPLDSRFQATPIADPAMKDWVEQNLEGDGSAVFVAEEPEGGIEGYVLALILDNPPVLPWPRFGYVSEIAVRRRRQGVGGKLLEAIHEWFRENGIPYVEVNVSIRNDLARQFWRKQGYGDFLERLRLEL